MEVEHLRFLFSGTVPVSECAYMLGVAILSEHLNTVAGFFMNGTSTVSKWITRGRSSHASQDEVKESIAFVQGSGLDVVINSYGLNVDPDNFRESFFEMVDYWKRKKKSL